MQNYRSVVPPKSSGEVHHRIAVSLAILSATVAIVASAGLFSPAAQASPGSTTIERQLAPRDFDHATAGNVEHISFRDLDLTRVSDVAILRDRVRDAVGKVCRPAEALPVSDGWLTCLESASIDAELQISQAVATAQTHYEKRAVTREAVAQRNGKPVPLASATD